MITLLFFAALREQAGTGERRVALPASIHTVGALRAWLAETERLPLAESERVHCAVNQTLAAENTPVGAGDEVAFFPPMTGG